MFWKRKKEELKPRYKFAFQITTHIDIDHLDLLMRKIYSKENLYLIYFDAKSTEKRGAVFNKYAPIDNIILVSDTNISWASASILDTTLNGLDILQRSATWQQYVLISGQDFPVISLSSFESRLEIGKNYVGCWSVLDNLSEAPYPSWDSRFDFNDQSSESDIIFSPRFSAVHVHTGTTFHYKDHHDLMRLSYNYTIDNVSNILSVSNNLGFQDKFLRNWLLDQAPNGRARRLAFGQAWVSLSREFVEWVLTSPFSSECYMLIRKFLFPDECFFQTCIINSPFESTHVNATTSWYDAEFQGRLNAEVFKRALEGGQLFARKLDPVSDSEFLAAYQAANNEAWQKPTADYVEAFPEA